ncbi:hypothetical protein F511_30725 [Dorcoceras hygrometricum]|uniref:Uncharacterized protein n=1 Tax=Dorcoceras hygrometricum TaxID=472368 RepID=A0A2Z7B6I9_9LAMI|nr:hypothetical protein F511_30725 [Dorcoceras hygrometricum]
MSLALVSDVSVTGVCCCAKQRLAFQTSPAIELAFQITSVVLRDDFLIIERRLAQAFGFSGYSAGRGADPARGAPGGG